MIERKSKREEALMNLKMKKEEKAALMIITNNTTNNTYHVNINSS